MKFRQYFHAFSFTFLFILVSGFVFPFPDNDKLLEGRWREGKPVTERDDPETFELRFNKKGHFEMLKVVNVLEGGTWQPSSAVQVATGDDDEWSTENGYLTLKVRERYEKNKDWIFRYRISSDTLILQKAEIFDAEGEPQFIFGRWNAVRYDQNYPGDQFRRIIEVKPEGKLIRDPDGKKQETLLSLSDAYWMELSLDDKGQIKDTTYQYYERIGDHLYLYEKNAWAKMIKRE